MLTEINRAHENILYPTSHHTPSPPSSLLCVPNDTQCSGWRITEMLHPCGWQKAQNIACRSTLTMRGWCLGTSHIPPEEYILFFFVVWFTSIDSNTVELPLTERKWLLWSETQQCNPDSSLLDNFTPYYMDIKSMIPPPSEEGFSASHAGDEVTIYQELEALTTTT